MSRPTSRLRATRRRLLATALTVGLLIPGAVVATPAYADSEILNPLDQSSQFDENLPVLEDSVVESLHRGQGGSAAVDAKGPSSATASREASTTAAPLAYRYVVIANDGLNVRTGAGASHQKVASLAGNTKVVITGRSKAVGGATWREITVGTIKGWVHGGYLMRDFEAGTAKSSLAKTGRVSRPTPKNGIYKLRTTWQAQPNGYWCGPASIVIGLSASGTKTNQTAMAQQAQTDREGTWLHQVARVMDYNAPLPVRYTVTTIPGKSQKATPAQRIKFRDDMARSIKEGVPGMVNIAATPNEQAWLHRAKTGGRYTLRHHMPVVGYDANTNRLLVDDPWTKPFWLHAYLLADMTVTRGYATKKR